MKIGTRSVLFGVHQVLIHPWFVAWAWWQLYGFRPVGYVPTYLDLDDEPVPHPPGSIVTHFLDWRLWLAFFVHDLGYYGQPNMDGLEGEQHPALGARILFVATGKTTWPHFVLYHSRYLAKRSGVPFSPLCLADKLAIALTPAWLYLLLANLSGEITEYMARARHRAVSGESKHLRDFERWLLASDRQGDWYAGLQSYMRRWVEEHKDGRADVWTPVRKEMANG